MWSSLPLSIRMTLAGLSATVVLIAGAVAVRTPPHIALEQDVAEPRPASSDRPVVARAAGSTGESPAVHAMVAPPGPGAARSAAPPAEPSATPSADAREARTQLRKDLQFGRYAAATADLVHLLDLDPHSAEDGAVRADICELAMRVMLLTGDEPDRVFELITQKMGTVGIDILYELITTRGGSRAAARADELLRDEKIRARGTPALRIAYDLRVTMGCDEKKALFARARTDGDSRTLGELYLLNRHCGRHAAGCCFHNDPELKEATDALKARSN
jgi:serine/threonine-protein kinase